MATSMAARDRAAELSGLEAKILRKRLTRLEIGRDGADSGAAWPIWLERRFSSAAIQLTAASSSGRGVANSNSLNIARSVWHRTHPPRGKEGGLFSESECERLAVRCASPM